MWSLLSRSRQLALVVGATLVAVWAIESVAGSAIPVLKLMSGIATLLGVGLAGLFQLTWRWFWRRVPALGRWIFPDLNGCWEGHIVRSGVDLALGGGAQNIPVTVRIRQGLFGISVRMKTAESQSVSLRPVLEVAADRTTFRVWYAYDNQPLARVSHRSGRHDGMAFLEANLQAPDQLRGQYYTSRRSAGDLELTRRSADPNAPD
jgi:SMODS-associating 2TM, beta-strand rich effector domain